MRIRVRQGEFTVRAIAGTNVVLFGMNLTKATAGSKLLGFGFERIDDESPTQARRPLMGSKTFAETAPRSSGPSRPVSTLRHPVQAFLWGDYTAEPGHDYTYRVVALGGTPSALVPLAEITDYQARVKSLTGGEGTFTMELSHYDPVPPRKQQELMKAFKTVDED